MPQPPQHTFRGAGHKDDKPEEAIKKLYDHVHDLHRALHGQLDHLVGRGGGTDTGGSTTESLGLTVKPQVVAQCYNTLGWYDAMGAPTSRNALLEFFNPGNAGVAWEATVSLNNIDLTASPFARTEKFAVEIRGIYHASLDGVHFFGLDVDGTAELLINGTVVCARYTSGPRVGNLLGTTGSLPLTAGYHNLVLRWVAGAPGPNAGLQVGVQKPGDSAPAVIPAADLGHYSGGLEAGAPTQHPVPQLPTTVPTGSTSFITTLPWTYTQPAPSGSEKLADGFILYFEEGVTGTPTKNQQKLAVTALSYNFTWPKNRQTSYAIATYRKTENGEEVGPVQTRGEWQGIVSTDPILIADPLTNPSAPSGTMDVGNGGNQNINPGGNVNVLAGGNVNIGAGGNVNVAAGGAVNVTGGTITLLAGGLLYISGGLVRVASGQAIEIQSIVATPTAPGYIAFVDAANTGIALIHGAIPGGQNTLQWDPVVDAALVGSCALTLGDNVTPRRWKNIFMGAQGDIVFSSTFGLVLIQGRLASSQVTASGVGPPAVIDKRLPIYDVAGTLIGYIPIYNIL